MERTWKPLTAGIVTIVSGAASIGKGTFILLLRGVLDNVDWGRWLGQWGGVWGPGMGWPEMFRFWPHAGMIEMLMLGASIALVTVGIIAIVGGIYAIRRRKWGLALAGSILAVPGIPPAGVFALVLIAMSKKEFNTA
jgi:hypothetical protein